MYDENEWGENVRMTRRRQQKQAARKRMIMIGAAIAVFLIIVGGIAGLYFHGKNSSDAKSTTVTETTTKKTDAKQTSEASTETKETQTSEEKTADDLSEQLQAIVNDYSKKMEEKTPVLIEEYQTEIQGNQEGIAGLSAVANQKARELQAISDEGIGKLRAAYQSADNKDDWAQHFQEEECQALIIHATKDEVSPFVGKSEQFFEHFGEAFHEA